MRVTILGSGTCAPKAEAASPGYFVEAGDLNILMDCGAGSLRQLVKAGKDFKEIDIVLLSHFHIDHTMDLAALFQAMAYTSGFKREKDLYIIGPPGLDDFLNNFNNVYHFDQMTPNYEVKTMEITDPINFQEQLLIEAIPAAHFEESVSFKLTHEKSCLVYTGDTGPNDKLASFAKGAKVMIVDCSFPYEDTEAHLSLPSVVKLGKKVKPKGLVLTHQYYEPNKYNLKKYEKDFPGKLVLAKDLQVLEL